MSVVTRTNRATNPNVASASTNWGVVNGTGGTANGARLASPGYDGTIGFWRASWSVGTSAVSGGVSYTQTGLSASTQYTMSMWVKPAVSQTMRLQAQFQNSSSTNVNNVNGSSVAVTGNSWVRLSVTGTSGSGVDRVVLSAVAVTGGTNWTTADHLNADAVLIETGSVLNEYYDGAKAAGNGITYAWTGTANASTSTATVYTPVLTLSLLTSPCDGVQITVADLPLSEHSVTIWRNAGDTRLPIRDGEEFLVTGTDFREDYEAPMGRQVSYELEILSGMGAGSEPLPASITTPSDHGWIQDPLVPENSIPLYTEVGPNGEPYLTSEAVARLSYGMDVSLVPIMGSPKKVALTGQRWEAGNVSFDLGITAAVQAAAVRRLMKSAPIVLIRPLPSWSPTLPDLCYIAAPEPVEIPQNAATGNTIFDWKLSSDLIEAPTMNLVVPVWTHGDFMALWATYQQAQTALSGDTYIQVRKSPTGA